MESRSEFESAGEGDLDARATRQPGRGSRVGTGLIVVGLLLLVLPALGCAGALASGTGERAVFGYPFGIIGLFLIFSGVWAKLAMPLMSLAATSVAAASGDEEAIRELADTNALLEEAMTTSREERDALEQAEQGESAPVEVVKIRCRTCYRLNDEVANFCSGCGAQL